MGRLAEILPSVAYWVALIGLSAPLPLLLYRYFVAPPEGGGGIASALRRASFYARFARGGQPVAPSIPPFDARARRERFGIVLLRVALLAFASRALIVAGAEIAAAVRGVGSTFESPVSSWVRWDAPHYMGLAENGYVTEGDPRFHIVFFPLFPLLVRFARGAFQGNAPLAAAAVSNLCLIASGVLLHYTVAESRGDREARRAVRYLMLCPLTVFFSVPYTESLYLALTLGAVYSARRRKFALAILLGALSSATRSFGLLAAIPIFYEMMKALREGEGWRASSARARSVMIALRFLAACGVALGFIAYLILNWRVTGDPFQFMVYQREHWHHAFALPWDTLRDSVANALNKSNGIFWRLGIWATQSTGFAVALFVLALTASRGDPGDCAFLWVTLFASFASAWTISGGRYLAAAYALYPLLARIGRHRLADAAITAAFAALAVVCAIQYAVTGNLL